MLPLAAVLGAPPAAATAIKGATISSSTPAFNSDIGAWNYDFTVNANGATVTLIELPEVQAGEYLSSNGTVLGLPEGWSSQEYATSQVPGDAPTFKSGTQTPAEYLDLTDSGITGSATFDLESNTGAYIDSNATVEYSNSNSVMLDPPTPNPVPEPGTLALLGSGILGLFGLRRRARRG